MANNIIDSIQLSGITYQIQGSGGGGKAIEAGRGIAITTGETADTVSFDLPISAGTGYQSIVEGNASSADGIRSHAEGSNTIANGNVSHAEGVITMAVGNNSHSEGNHTTASGNYSHAEGWYTITNNQSEHASGQYNVSNSASTTFGDSGNTLFSVGNGTPESARHNAFEIRQNGDIYISSGGTDIKLQDHLGGGGSSHTAGDGIDITNDVISVTGKVDTSTYNTYTAATDTALASKADTATTYTKTEVDTALGGKADTSAVTEVSDALTAHTANTTVHTTAAEKTSWNGAVTDIATVSGQVSTNTTNIATVSAATTANTTALGGLSLIKLTQAEYDALVTKDNSTLYVIVD